MSKADRRAPIRDKQKHHKTMFEKTYLRKFGAPMTSTTAKNLRAKRSLAYQRLHLSIPNSTLCLMAVHDENSRNFMCLEGGKR